MKEVKYTPVFDGTIIEFTLHASKFIKGAFKSEILPIIGVIKGMIPASAREYDPSRYTWSITAEYWEPVKTICIGAGFKITEVKPSGANVPNVEVPKDYEESFYHKPEAPPSPNAETAATIATKLSIFLGTTITTQDVSELKKLYRRKALELHPDRNNGDGTKMSELNRLWTLYTAQDRMVN